MKNIKISSFIILICAALLLVSFEPNAPTVGKITFPLGNVLLLTKGATRYQKVYLNMPVKNGDKIETKKTARCEITFNDKSVVRIDEQTIYTIEKVNITSEKKEVSSFLFLGKLWANVKKLISSKDSWRLKSPSAVVAVRGTVYRMNAGADSSSQVLVHEGNATVSPAGKSAG
ncbi:MAG: FecR family protein, partial [Calditrichia bacterium]